MNHKFSFLLLFILVFGITQSLYSQISVKKTEVDYSLTFEEDSVLRILTFWKDKDAKIYSSVKYTISDFNTNSSIKKLSDETSIINQLWDIAKDSIELNLRSFNIGYPLLYSDILYNHIEAFNKSKEWQKHAAQNGKTLNYDIIKKLMEESDVYKPLNELLKSKNYYISGFETEKHGFVTKEKLQKAGFSGSEIIPMPFIVWAIIEQTKN